MSRRENPVGTEESIEAAKYAVTAAGMAPGERRLADLLEDIDRLPAARHPQLGLLPQKPGVLHAYWALPAGADVARARLRLCRIEANTVEVIEEVALPAMSGHWYFHVPEGGDAGTWCVHLGQYNSLGNFVSSFERAIARIPTPYAEGRRTGNGGSAKRASAPCTCAPAASPAASVSAGPARSAAASPSAWHPKAISRLSCTRTCRSCAIRSTTVSSKRTGSSRR